MPHALLDRHPAGLLDLLLDHVAAHGVVDDVRPGIGGEDVTREEGRREVAQDAHALLVHEHAAVAVAVEGDAEVAAIGFDRLAEVDQVLAHDRVGGVVGEGPVGLEVELDRLDLGQTRQELLDGRAGDSVAAVDRDLEGSDLAARDLQHVIEVGLAEVRLRRRPARREGRGELALAAGLDLVQTRLAPDGADALAANLEPVVAGRVVAGGDHHAAGQLTRADREVERR